MAVDDDVVAAALTLKSGENDDKMARPASFAFACCELCDNYTYQNEFPIDAIQSMELLFQSCQKSKKG